MYPAHWRATYPAVSFTDDATSSVIFHLTAPDPDFLYELSNHVVATPPRRTGQARAPARCCDRAVPDRQVPAGEELQLCVRNPYFRQWSFAAQPAGLPRPDAAGIVRPVAAAP